jgi:hypothetical protein
MMKTKLALSLSILLLFVLSACGGAAEPTLLPAPTETPAPPTAGIEGPPDPPEEGFPLPAKPLTQLAVLSLAQRQGVEVDSIELLRVEVQEWPDAAIGCPQEGYDYAQVITPGYRITLEAEGTEYVYHTDQGTFVVLCLQNGPEELPVIPILPGERIMDGIPWMPVDPIPGEGDIADPAPIK